MRRGLALFLSGVVTFGAVLAFPVTSHAQKSLSSTMNFVKQEYHWEYGISQTDSGIAKTVSIATSNDDMEIEGTWGWFAFADEYAAYYQLTYDELPEDWAYDGMIGVEMGVDTDGSFYPGDTVTFYMPEPCTAFAYLENDDSNWTVSVGQDYVTLTAKEDICEYEGCFVGIVYTPGIVAPSETYFWVTPVKEKLSAAASSSDNAKKVVEYSGDYALPAETMQYLKDHPDVTLKYSFVLNGENRTVTLSGKDIVVDPKIKWYGLEYLWVNYGLGAAKADAATGEYIVVSGDTLSKIAAKFGTTVAKLAAKNGIKDVNYIYVGQKILY